MSERTPDLPDPFAEILSRTDAHRAEHGCGAYPYDKGTLLGVLAAATRAERIVEVGTALGYSAIWLAHGAPRARVDTIEADAEHVRIAREHGREFGMSDRVHVHHGNAVSVLNGLDANAYDLAFFDGYAPSPELITGIGTRLRTGGLFACANVTLAGPEASQPLWDADTWLTHSFGETALAVKR